MKSFALFIGVWIVLVGNLSAQNQPLEIDHYQSLHTTNDTFYVQGSNWDEAHTFTTRLRDTVDLGTDGYSGVTIRVWSDSDTLTIPYVNAPYRQWVFIPVFSPNDSTVYRLRFNAQNALFSDAYVSDHKDSYAVLLPPAYELANIILYLTDCSVRTGNHPEDQAYAQRVVAHFGQFKNHPLVRQLNALCSTDDYWSVYYGFRENSISYRIQNGLLQYDTPYKYVRWDISDAYGGSFRTFLYLVQDFLTQSDFIVFYEANTDYYNQLANRLEALMPMRQMWNWLETEFPARYDAYKVYFSPLIEGSHSTQNFYKGDFRDPEYRECAMFINSAESLDAASRYSEAVKEGLQSGIVFTEIDHNYVNPVSRKYLDAVKTLMNKEEEWATDQARSNYTGAYAIFNEYMTHALFCMYMSEHYEAAVAQEVIDARIRLMNRRGFSKFESFLEVTTKLTEERVQTIYELYPSIIEALQAIN